MGVFLPVIFALFLQGPQATAPPRFQTAHQASSDAPAQAAQEPASGTQSPQTEPQASGAQQPTSTAQQLGSGAQQGSAGQQPASAGRQPSSAAKPSGAKTPPDTPAPPQPGSFDDIYSIERIKKELERKPALTFTMPDPNAPRYRVEIQGQRAMALPGWQQNFRVPVPPVPQPFGGSDYYTMQRLNTPPQYWGSAPFTNSDLLKTWGLTGAYGLAGALIKKGIEARQSAAEARAHQEVLQELADLQEHNARIAAGQADGDDDGKAAADKKKQDEEKKKKRKPGDEKQ